MESVPRQLSLGFWSLFLLKCNYHVRFLPKVLPKFFWECLNKWAAYKNAHAPVTCDVLKEIIWNKKFILVGGKPLFRKKIVNKGIIKLRDVLTNAGKLKTWNILKNKNIMNAEYFLFMSVFSAIPLEWKNLMKVQLQNIQTFSNVAHDFTFPNSSRVLYWDLVKKIGTIQHQNTNMKNYFQPLICLGKKFIFFLEVQHLILKLGNFSTNA